MYKSLHQYAHVFSRLSLFGLAFAAAAGAEPEPDGDLLRRRDQGRPGTGLFQTLRAKRRRAGGRRRIQRRNGQGEGHGRRRQGQLGRGRGGEPRTAPRLRRGAVRTPRPGAFRRPAQFVPGTFSECGVATYVWSMVMAYDSTKLARAPQSWADFWNVREFPGKRGLRKGAKYTLEVALLADGVKAEDLYKVLATPEGQPRLRQARPAQAEHPVVGGRRPAAAMAGGRRRGDERGLQRAHRRCAEGG